MTIAPVPRAALVAYLAADPDVASLAENRVFGAELPEEEAVDMPRYAVVVQNAGGSGNYALRFDVRAYGATPAQADYLQQACKGALERLERKVINQTILHDAVKETGPFPGRSQTSLSLWPFSFSTWSIGISYTEVKQYA